MHKPTRPLIYYVKTTQQSVKTCQIYLLTIPFTDNTCATSHFEVSIRKMITDDHMSTDYITLWALVHKKSIHPFIRRREHFTISALAATAHGKSHKVSKTWHKERVYCKCTIWRLWQWMVSVRHVPGVISVARI